ncbi:hypothetical protein [Flavobacterium sp. 5]|uniref:hypothetical protein n=1 Tax=Flavobacterium sp. 5 TaxID=2035199 RepID=UPI000C2BDCCF|nr:hypothetical protein [Flavobacterium sp. 5]PKB15130.1 hypothetical protein CLU82_0193 [Flavobacterium sp. 5]
MRKIILVLLLLFTKTVFGQKIEKVEAKTFDTKLVGCWKGSEMDQQQNGVTKYWVSCRFENGTSTLLFIAIDKKGKVTQNTENGKWWVENGKYYELHNYDGVTDIYDYQLTDDGIKFTAVEVMGDKNSKYTFFDYKIEE